MYASALCELFYEVIEALVTRHGHLLDEFHTELMQRRAKIYSKSKAEKGSSLGNCVGFLDCTKI